MTGIMRADATGSSPHTRGAQHDLHAGEREGGIIPAYAGSTRPRSPSRRCTGDHPRIRGEHPPIITSTVPSSGSSPHARGAPGRDREDLHGHGIIPACAGSTEHARGLLRPPAGSSPHARGALVAGGLRHHLRGIIPACAGSTSALSARRRTRGDHPRMRGEHFAAGARDVELLGSSPHARGALGVEGHFRVVDGIIPACAGSTGFCIPVRLDRRDHPRMRGEHPFGFSGNTPNPGSSPHARGAREGLAFCIPVLRDHPRMRGEHVSHAREWGMGPGSSPHARGARGGGAGHGPRQGIIPACAGSTRGGSRSCPPPRDHPRMRGEHRSVQVRHHQGGGIIPACAGSTGARFERQVAD